MITDVTERDVFWKARVVWYCQETDLLSQWIGLQRMHTTLAVRPACFCTQDVTSIFREALIRQDRITDTFESRELLRSEEQGGGGEDRHPQAVISRETQNNSASMDIRQLRWYHLNQPMANGC